MLARTTARRGIGACKHAPYNTTARRGIGACKHAPYSTTARRGIGACSTDPTTPPHEEGLVRASTHPTTPPHEEGLVRASTHPTAPPHEEGLVRASTHPMGQSRTPSDCRVGRIGYSALLWRRFGEGVARGVRHRSGDARFSVPGGTGRRTGPVPHHRGGLGHGQEEIAAQRARHERRPGSAAPQKRRPAEEQSPPPGFPRRPAKRSTPAAPAGSLLVAGIGARPAAWRPSRAAQAPARRHGHGVRFRSAPRPAPPSNLPEILARCDRHAGPRSDGRDADGAEPRLRDAAQRGDGRAARRAALDAAAGNPRAATCRSTASSARWPKTRVTRRWG